jgi:hypothetical protein
MISRQEIGIQVARYLTSVQCYEQTYRRVSKAEARPKSPCQQDAQVAQKLYHFIATTFCRLLEPPLLSPAGKKATTAARFNRQGRRRTRLGAFYQSVT